ncbi:Plasmid stability protein [Serratia quinivorans]|uniref:plasmid partitioning/stability family protein n=1 Tax=Serratia TaxID=613 RepID=UPI001F4BF300|nr:MULTISPECIES: plasmid partitioning/stability family protein [Serratia]ULG18740.1 InhB [Serratia proteamaculans]CAI1222719.1 Plasmid stability protein [Serratia quinivorans]
MSDNSSDTRRKFTSYLQLDCEADRRALDVVESISQRVRGDFLRNAIITTAALHQLDPRLPVLLATMYNGQLTSEQLVNLVSETTGWKPDRAAIRDVIAALSGDEYRPMNQVDPVPKSDEVSPLDGAREKLGKLL